MKTLLASTAKLVTKSSEIAVYKPAFFFLSLWAHHCLLCNASRGRRPGRQYHAQLTTLSTNNGWLENQYGLFPAGIFVLFFIVQCKVTQHVIYYKITQRAVLCTPGLKALADTVCTERCIAFNGGTPHFVFFSSGHKHAEWDGHKTTCQTNGRRHWLCGKPKRRALSREGES